MAVTSLRNDMDKQIKLDTHFLMPCLFSSLFAQFFHHFQPFQFIPCAKKVGEVKFVARYLPLRTLS